MSEMVVMPKDDYSSACDTIRGKTDTTELIKSNELASKIEDVYQKGYEQGKSEGGTSSDSYYDTFWNRNQQNGLRTNYMNAFSSPTTYMYIWTDENFIPKFDMHPISIQDMLAYSDVQDMRGVFERLGRVFDTSKCTNFTFAFRYSAVIYLPVLDLSSAGLLNCTFMGCSKLKALHLKNVTQNVSYNSNTFLGCSSLEEVVIEGEIGNSVDFGDSPLLTEASVESIGNAVIDVTGQTSKTITLNKVVIEKMTDEQKSMFTNKNWTIVSKG